MPLAKLGESFPKITKTSFVAPNAFLIGDVVVGSGSSIWYGCNIRGDVNYIRIGDNSNIQDGTIVHVARSEGGQTQIGNYVTIGHQCLIHACTLMDETFIGMGSIVMDGSIIEKGSMVGAGSLVTSNKRIKSGELWMGRPAKFTRMLTPDEVLYIRKSAERYVILSKEYLADL